MEIEEPIITEQEVITRERKGINITEQEVIVIQRMYRDRGQQ